MVMNSILRLPAGLICSSARLRPATQLVPKNDHGPVSSVTNPIFTGSWARAVVLKTRASAKPVASILLCLFIVIPSRFSVVSSHSVALQNPFQPQTFLVARNLARHANVVHARHIHQEPARQRDVRRDARALLSQRLLGDLYDDLLPFLRSEEHTSE